MATDSGFVPWGAFSGADESNDYPSPPYNTSIDNPPLPIRDDPEPDTPDEPKEEPAAPDSKPKKA